MSDHYNHYALKHFAAMVADCMDVSLPASFAPPIPWISEILKRRLGGVADRAVLYHADAVGMYIWQQYTDLFAPVYRNAALTVPYVSTVESVTPVAHASMYTGLDPVEHGILTYVRPQLTCTTLYDVLLEKGKRPAIVAAEDSTFLHIFKGREMDYYVVPDATGMRDVVMELLAKDCYDLISIHTFDYDTAAHHTGPESKESLDAVAHEAAIYAEIAEFIKRNYVGKHRTLLTYTPDHGQHELPDGKGDHGSKMIEDMNIVHFMETIS